MIVFIIQSPICTNVYAKNKVKVLEIGIANTFGETNSNAGINAGDYVRRGINIALADHAHALKKLEIEIKLVEFNYNNSEASVIRIADQAAQSGIIALHGYDYSSHSLAAASVHQQAGLAMLTPTSTADRLSSFGKYVHQIPFNNSYQASVLAFFAFKKLKAKRVHIVAPEDCAYCQDLKRAFKLEFEKLGGKITLTKPFLSADVDPVTIADEISSYAKPDLILLPNYEVLSTKIVSSLLALGVRIPFIGGDGWTSLGERVFRSVVDSPDLMAYAITHWHPSVKSVKSIRFAKSFRAKYKMDPEASAALSYDTMSIILTAIVRAKQYTRLGIEQSINSIGSYQGVTGFIDLTGKARDRRSIFILSYGKMGVASVLEINNSRRASP